MSLFRAPVVRQTAAHVHLRQPRVQLRARLASTTTEAAKEAASSAAGKAQAAAGAAKEQASSAYTAAQARAGQVLEGVSKAAGGVGERVGSMLGSYRQPLFYNLTVARELLKQVYVAEKLAPPTSFSTWQSAYQTMFNRAKDVNYWQELLRSGAWAKVGIYALEAYGIFKIGEMVGRRSVVGYSLN